MDTAKRIQIFGFAFAIVFLATSITQTSQAAPPVRKLLFTHPKSDCQVRNNSAEQYSDLQIEKKGHSIFSVKSDSAEPSFSADGKYIAFAGGGIDAVAFEGSSYLLLIYNCEKQVAKGYGKITPNGNEHEPYVFGLKWKSANRIVGTHCTGGTKKDPKSGRYQDDCNPYSILFNTQRPLP